MKRSRLLLLPTLAFTFPLAILVGGEDSVDWPY